MDFTFLCSERPEHNSRKVAIIGSGPSGLAATGYLACAGYKVEVYDKLPRPGGLMVFGIPGHRIPPENIARGAEKLEKDFGVVFRLRTKICGSEPMHQETGDDMAYTYKSLGGRVEDNDAVLICTGTWKSRRMNIPGNDLPGVYSGLEFLFPVRAAGYEISNMEVPRIKGKKVVVIGAGFTAVDAVHAALSEGAEQVRLIYRRSREEAPCGSMEFNMLEKKGTECMEHAAPLEIIGTDRVEAVKVAPCAMSRPDAQGKCRLEVKESAGFEIKADIVVTAIGEMGTPPFAHDLGLDEVRKGEVKWLQMTSLESVFVAGDVLIGPSRIGKAVYSGLKAARSLDQWLTLKSQGRLDEFQGEVIQREDLR